VVVLDGRVDMTLIERSVRMNRNGATQRTEGRNGEGRGGAERMLAAQAKDL
jgi:hypothetical protein